MEERHVRAQRATLGTMFTYGLGAVSIGIKNNLLGYFLLIYYNRVLGLNAVLAASAMAVALVIDAVRIGRIRPVFRFRERAFC